MPRQPTVLATRSLHKSSEAISGGDQDDRGGDGGDGAEDVELEDVTGAEGVRH